MKLLLTILLGLLLVQAVFGLHLHTEGEDAGNTTATVDTGNVTATVAANATASSKSEEDQKMQKIRKNYDAIVASGDEDHISAARKAKAEFEADVAETKEKVEAASKLSEDPTDQERQAALKKISQAQLDLKHSLYVLSETMDILKKQLDDKQTNSDNGSD